MEKPNVNAQEDGLEIDYFNGSWEIQISGKKEMTVSKEYNHGNLRGPPQGHVSPKK